MDIKQATTYSKEARQVMLGLFYAWPHHHQAGPRHRPSAPGSKPSLLPGNDRLARAEHPWWPWHHHHLAGPRHRPSAPGAMRGRNCFAVPAGSSKPLTRHRQRFCGHQTENRGTNRGTKWLFKIKNIAFMRVARHKSIPLIGTIRYTKGLQGAILRGLFHW